MIDKETIIRQLKTTSSEIAQNFDELYSDEINEIAEELSISFNNSLIIINYENQKEVSDNDFQAALLFWSGANAIIGSVELFRRGYYREPLIILRHSLEVMSTAYCAHKDPKISQGLLKGPKEGKGVLSTKNISEAKKIQPIIGPMYGILSQNVSHVSALHIMPHGSKKPLLCVGGLYDPETQKYSPMALSMILTATEILNSLIEVAFITKIKNIRFWERMGDDILKYEPLAKIRERQKKILNTLEENLFK
jgi:hypothetical protein